MKYVKYVCCEPDSPDYNKTLVIYRTEDDFTLERFNPDTQEWEISMHGSMQRSGLGGDGYGYHDISAREAFAQLRRWGYTPPEGEQAHGQKEPSQTRQRTKKKPAG